MIIKADLSDRGLDNAIKALDQYMRDVEIRAGRILDRLAQIGLNVTQANFSLAQYDGYNDVQVKKVSTDGFAAVIAFGEAVLFIEFGTGVHYGSAHPQAAEFGYTRGSYGIGHGKQDRWRYYGEPGTNGNVVGENDKGTLVETHGNPANRCMYDAAKVLEASIRTIAKEELSR